MGIYALNEPGRAGEDVAKYDGWAMSMIIRDFVFNQDLNVEYTRMQLRRALLVSNEYNSISKGARINV